MAEACQMSRVDLVHTTSTRAPSTDKAEHSEMMVLPLPMPSVSRAGLPAASKALHLRTLSFWDSQSLLESNFMSASGVAFEGAQ